jgi:hypothetical protein
MLNPPVSFCSRPTITTAASTCIHACICWNLAAAGARSLLQAKLVLSGQCLCAGAVPGTVQGLWCVVLPVWLRMRSSWRQQRHGPCCTPQRVQTRLQYLCAGGVQGCFTALLLVWFCCQCCAQVLCRALSVSAACIAACALRQQVHGPCCTPECTA